MIWKNLHLWKNVHFIFSSLLLKDWNVINVKFCIAKIVLLKWRPHQAKETFSRYNKQLGKNFPWLIIELENNLLGGLFCKVCLKYGGKLKGLGEYDGKFVSQGKVVSWSCSVKTVFLIISQNSQENTCARDYFLKESLPQVFSCEFCEIPKNTSKRLRLTSFMTPKAKA